MLKNSSFNPIKVMNKKINIRIIKRGNAENITANQSKICTDAKINRGEVERRLANRITIWIEAKREQTQHEEYGLRQMFFGKSATAAS
jgi:hypothetical protein